MAPRPFRLRIYPFSISHIPQYGKPFIVLCSASVLTIRKEETQSEERTEETAGHFTGTVQVINQSCFATYHFCASFLCLFQTSLGALNYVYRFLTIKIILNSSHFVAEHKHGTQLQLGC